MAMENLSFIDDFPIKAFIYTGFYGIFNCHVWLPEVEHVSDEDTFLYVIRIYNRETLESCLQLDYLT